MVFIPGLTLMLLFFAAAAHATKASFECATSADIVDSQKVV